MENKLIIAVFIGVLVIAVLVNALRQPAYSPTVSGTSSLNGPTSTSAVSSSTAPAASPKSGVQTYRSSALDLSFNYNASDTGVLEESNTIYVYPLEMKPMEGQWIQGFSKLPSETFAQSIERQILAGFSTANCEVLITQNKVYPGTYSRAEISYPEPSDPNAPFWQNASQCNEAYARTNGIRFFLYDSAHPDRFYFISIGQYPVVVSGTKTWQDTLVIGK